MLGYLIYKYVLSLINRPVFQKSSILYQDWFASGYSVRNILTRLGRAHGVLRLVVTNEILWVTSWFPFSLLGPFYDMEHVIPLSQITNIERRQGFRSIELQLSYTDAKGVIHSLRLTPKDENEFLKALKHKSGRV